ncbi:beta strand repeat-containing protein, partial [Sulfurimonas sp.]
TLGTITDSNFENIAADASASSVVSTIIDNDFTDADEVVSTNEDTPITGTVLENSTDGHGHTLEITGFTIGSTTYSPGDPATIAGVGVVTIEIDGSYNFIPVANYNGAVPTISYTISSGVSTDTSTLDITVNPVNDAPVAIDSMVTLDEDTTYTYTLSDFGYSDVEGDVITAVRIDSLPVMGDLYYNGVLVSTTGLEIDVADISSGLLTFEADLHDSGSDEYIDDGAASASVGEQSASYAQFDYSVSDGTSWSDTSATMTIDVNAVADAPLLDVSASTVTTETITVDTVSETTSGYTVSALNVDGTTGTISTHTTSPEGFGVSGLVDGNNGADSEIGYDPNTGTSEQIVVTFDEDVSSVDVSLAWNANSEDVAIAFYNNGVLIETITTGGGTDGIDNLGTLQPSSGEVFDEIRFYAPNTNDDFLIHSISFERTVTSNTLSVNEGDDISLDIASSLVDTDGSESLTLSITDIPEGATITDGTNTFTATAALTSTDITGWNLTNITFNMPNVDAASVDYTLNVVATSTEYSNGDSASTTVPVTITVNDSQYVSLQNNTAEVDEAALSTGTDSASTAEIVTGNILSDDEIGSDFSLSYVSISGGTTVDNGTTYTVTTAEGNVLVVDQATGDYTYTLNNPVEHFTKTATGSTITLVETSGDAVLDTFTIDSKDGWDLSRDTTNNNDRLNIDGGGDTATKTFYFGELYANTEVTLNFTATTNSNWDGGNDNFVVTANGTEVVNDSYYGAQTTNYSVTVTLDADGNATIVMTNSSNNNNEDIYIDNVTFTGPEFDVTLLDTVTDSFTYTVSDGTTDYQATLDVTIQDDAPIVNDSATVSISLPESVDTNMLLTLDVSGSMNSSVNGSTRFEIARDALIDTINEYANAGSVNVNLTLFNGTALNVNGGWMTSAEAIDYLNHLTMNGNYIQYNGANISGLDSSVQTNYEMALAATDDTYYTNTPTADRTVAYFLSDGAPTREIDDGSAEETGLLDSSYVTAWGSFISANNIDLEVVGIGNGVDETYLDMVQTTDGKDTIVVSDVTTLSSTLVATVDSVEGTLFDSTDSTAGISFGADGGYISEISYSGTTYSYDPHNITQDLTLSEGTLSLNFDTGAFVYTPTTSSGVDITETFDLSVADSDGDITSNTVSLLIGIDTTYNYDGTAVDGGAGYDTITLLTNASLDSVDFAQLDNIEEIDMSNSGTNSIDNLSLNDVLDMTDADNTLVIKGDDGVDSLNSVDTTGWTENSKTDDGTNTTYEYTDGTNTVTLIVEDQIDNTGM